MLLPKVIAVAAGNTWTTCIYI